jgi:hypothetical protein
MADGFVEHTSSGHDHDLTVDDEGRYHFTLMQTSSEYAGVKLFRQTVAVSIGTRDEGNSQKRVMDVVFAIVDLLGV